MKSYNPFRIIKELETGKLQSHPIGIQEVIAAIIIFIIFARLSQWITLNTSFHNQISGIIFILIINIAALMCLLIVCRELFFYEDEEGVCKNYKLSAKTYIYAIIILVGIEVFNNVISVLMIRYLDMSSYIESIRRILANNHIFAIMYICIIGPFVEELIYRGVLLGGFLKRYKPTIAIVISTVIFTIIHGNAPQMIAALILGTALGVLFIRFRSVILCFIVHALHNSISLIVTSNDKYLEIFKTQSLIVALFISILGLIFALYMVWLLSKESEKVKDIVNI